MKIDLHTHTYFSDGSFSPTEVVNTAIERKVKYLAITDHDNIDGINEALKAAKGGEIVVIPGIEIAAKVKCSENEIHIVGLYLDPKDQKTKKFSDDVLALRIKRTLARLSLINKSLKINITLEDLKKKTKGAPGRPHIWMVLLDKGFGKDIKEAKEIADKAAAGYTESKDVIDSEEAIKIIHSSGGLAVLAHLPSYKNAGHFTTYKEQEELVKELAGYGIDGIEVYIPDISKEDQEFTQTLAERYNLKVSIGSDFHDEKYIPNNKIGFLDIDRKKITILK